MTGRSTSRRARILTTVAAVVVIVLGAVVLAVTRNDDSRPGSASGGSAAATGEPAQVVRPNSHRLSGPADARATLVEFLDFECEACRAAFPVMEQLRADYADRVVFVVRYFPIPSHFNSGRAARAAEAAAGQGRFEQMYQRLFETQGSWGEKRVPADEVFRGFAADLGLDLTAYDLAYNDPATTARVRADFDEGVALGVQGTPTFFLNGEKISVGSYREMAAALDAALA